MQKINPEDKATWPSNGSRIHLITFGSVGIGFQDVRTSEGDVEWLWDLIDEEGYSAGTSCIYEDENPPEPEDEDGWYWKLMMFISTGDEQLHPSAGGDGIYWCSSDAWLKAVHDMMEIEFKPEDWKTV